MREIIKKIEPQLFALVKTQQIQKDDISCIVYARDYYRVKRYLQKEQRETLREYPFISAFGVKIPTTKLLNVAKSKDIKYITRQTKVFAQIDVAKKVINIENLKAQGLTGRDVTIAIIDTGIVPHLDFVYPNNRIVLFKDFVGEHSSAYDDNGHGTFVAGIACGSGLISGCKYSGVAPCSKIISLKTLDSEGETGAFTILEAMQWVYDNYKKYNIKIVCMSFGSNPLGGKDPLTLGAEALWSKGITVIAAAGNSGPEEASIKSPGVSPRIITVGAMDDKRDFKGDFKKDAFSVADFSSRGPAFQYYKPDLLAPGVNLKSTSNSLKDFYTTLSGTSVATPIVAGLCCLLLEKHPTLRPEEIKAILIKNARPIGGDRNSEGYGLIDASHLLDF